jgi:hypothetical protein
MWIEPFARSRPHSFLDAFHTTFTARLPAYPPTRLAAYLLRIDPVAPYPNTRSITSTYFPQRSASSRKRWRPRGVSW